MKYSSKTGKLTALKTQLLALPLREAQDLADALKQRDVLNAQLRDFEDKAGKTQLIVLPEGQKIERLLVLGGAAGSLSGEDFRKIVNALATALRGQPVTKAALALDTLSVDGLEPAQALLQALALLSSQLYWFDAYKSEKPKDKRLQSIELVVAGDTGQSSPSQTIMSQVASNATALSAGLDWARDLGNCPPNVCNPTYLAQSARKLGSHKKVRVSVLDEAAMKKLGMGAFLAVSQGSESPGKMIIIEYQGAPARSSKAKAAPVVLVGKGITFDTGGISLKPPAAMDEMKFDMCGAASVLGSTRAAIDAELPINLITIVAAAENMPSGRATRPGDIVTSMSGQTIEVLNTDAEGRMVLCDALTYAERYKPRAVVDVATLTGACVVALGSHASGLFSNDDNLAEELLQAGQAIWDRAWRMPVWEDYQPQLKSNFADMANVGGRDAGAVTAACFLSRFTKAYKWAHLDIAGSAWNSGANKGATGRAVPLLFQYLRQQCQ
jgi:leucyl aminopeptidase